MKKIVSLLALFLAAPLIAFAQGAPKFTELKPPQPVSIDGNKIEVIEFFWYGCPHCYNLEPVLETWLKKLPPDVQFKRVPAVFNPRWEHDAEIFYTFDAMGVLDKVHKPFFDAIHQNGLRTDNPEAMAQWLQRNGIDPKKFNETMKSFTVKSRTGRAKQMSIGYNIDGTPAMAVQGKYTVSAEQGGSREGMLQTVSYIVDQIRKGKLK
ncbi:MAG TPA: thiol:disulfide interchange protein DsbA/DsbL [Burkholderiales bacterium]|jgi:thiol:disulfide interchange protein DsbA|nr:thiol:disulfide interchange protein DsbA/DsbL [Burkholderiales bacterium]